MGQGEKYWIHLRACLPIIHDVKWTLCYYDQRVTYDAYGNYRSNEYYTRFDVIFFRSSVYTGRPLAYGP